MGNSFILAVLVCYRVAQFIALDDGPVDCFLRFRIWCAKKSVGLSKLVSCVYCVGVYPAFILSFIITCPSLPDLIYWRDLFLNWLAIAGGQALLQGLTDR